MHTLTNAEKLKRLANYSTEVKLTILKDDLEEDEADDIMQNAFVRATENIHTLRDLKFAKTWFTRIALNAKVDYFRDRSLELKHFGTMIPLEEAADLCYHDERLEMLVSDSMLADKIRHASPDAISCAIKKLPPRERAMFTLYYEDGLSWKEIAESMHLKETTVRVAVFRHKQDLIKHLEEYYRKENVL
ncbi:MAG: RNA polymerase sigma factor [Firmicutes bacterium]|nr:RNA polymerase sigma factor [Bacillota bacterium]